MPKDFDAMVRQQMDYARDWAQRDERVWSDPGEGFARKAEGVSSEKMTPERMEKLEQLRSALAYLAKRTQERLQEVEAVLEHFRRGQKKQTPCLGVTETASVPKSVSENEKKPPAKTVPGKAKPAARSSPSDGAEASEPLRTMGCRVGDATAGP